MTCEPFITAVFLLDWVYANQSNAATQTSDPSPKEGHGYKSHSFPLALWEYLWLKSGIQDVLSN